MLDEPNILWKKPMANYENKKHSLIKSRNQTKQTKLLSMIELVGGEIQCHVIKSRRGYDMVE